jgi:Penicillin-insensitive murein endopeptidase
LERASRRHSMSGLGLEGKIKSLDNMRRAVLCLILMLPPCGGVATEFSQLSGPANAPMAKRANGRVTPAKELFGAVTEPAPLASRAIGTYARGCLAGGVAVPITGPDWQVMRLSRNRNWGHPRLIGVLEACKRGTHSRRLARASDRRYGAAPRRANDHRPREPSDWTRR